MHQDSIQMLREELAQARLQSFCSQFPPGQSPPAYNTGPAEINLMQPFMPSKSLPLAAGYISPPQDGMVARPLSLGNFKQVEFPTFSGKLEDFEN